jgi:hypothetical protein
MTALALRRAPLVDRITALAPRRAALAGRETMSRAALLGLLGAAALVLGAAAATKPILAAGAAGLALVLAFAFRAPVAHLLTLVALTALVPLELQNRVSPLLLPSDVLLLAGLARAACVLAQLRLQRRALAVVALALAFLATVVVQLVHAASLGRSIAGTGAEARTLLGFATILVALPIVVDPIARGRLGRGLVGVGLALGVWGVAQFVLQLRFDVPTDLGAGPIGFNTAGRVVGMYAFPVASVLAMAALAAGVRTSRGRLALAAVLCLNAAATVLTFERTFMVATAFGFGALVAFGTSTIRRRVVVGAPLGVLATLAGLAILAPAVLSAAGQRLASIASYDADPSVYYRQVEGRLVLDQIEQRPLAGSGLAAAIHIGRPGTTQPIKPRRYAENGYLWLFWKVGVAGGAVLLVLLATCMLSGSARRHDRETGALVAGSQAALAALALATYFFPSVNQLAITPTLGVVAAICLAPPLAVLGRPEVAS